MPGDEKIPDPILKVQDNTALGSRAVLQAHLQADTQSYSFHQAYLFLLADVSAIDSGGLAETGCQW